MLDWMNQNADQIESSLQAAFHSAVAHLEGLENRPVAATASLSELRSRLARPLNDHGIDPEEVVRDLVRDTQDGILGSAGARFFAWAIGIGTSSVGGGLVDFGLGSECGSLCMRSIGRGSGGDRRRMAERFAGNSTVGVVRFRQWMPNCSRNLPGCGKACALRSARMGCRTAWTLWSAIHTSFSFQPARVRGAGDSTAGNWRRQRDRSGVERGFADYAGGARCRPPSFARYGDHRGLAGGS
jgi:hypothetical protein